ncbi:MAG: B12-binding domain-containing radical SAM protein, partial [Clostridia bacterium]|nr:B12-binding domain-containing radical SAM protein [Clostridia bacterium]
ALNGSYSHTCLALRCLRRPLESAGFEVTLLESNLKDRRDEVLQTLFAQRADVYSFSCYIWNIEETLSLAEDLSALLPSAKMIFGGPEVSFDTECFSSCNFIDCVVCGEGEDVLPELCQKISKGEALARTVCGRATSVMGGEGILYRDGDYKAGEMLYYESSRGCPYRCAYCLSSANEGVRAKPTDVVLADMQAFEKLSSDIRIIKFVDRTFNFDIARANAIWSALLDEKYTKNYHFEICASLLNEESFEILSRFKKGKIQLEIGLQSTNPETLAAVARHVSPKQVITATKRIHDMGNIHVHLDLIAGLPYESYARFAESFNESYFCSDMLQLGFLKLLHGTALRRDAKKYGYVCASKAPYTVLQTKWISRDELYRLARISDLLDRFYSSGRFSLSLDYAVRRAHSPFDFYEGLLEHLKESDGRDIRKLSQTDAFGLLYRYASTFLKEGELLEFEEKLHTDYAAHEVRQMPYSVIGGRKRK